MVTHKSQGIALINDYEQLLGSVIANLHSLEFMLRLYLYKKRSSPHASFRRGQNFTGLLEGATLPINALTDYQTLGDLIKGYNTLVKRRHSDLEIEQGIVNLRDALAHGRVFVPKSGLPLQLLKFSKPHNDKVVVTFSATLSSEWLTAQNVYIQKAIVQVRASQ